MTLESGEMCIDNHEQSSTRSLGREHVPNSLIGQSSDLQIKNTPFRGAFSVLRGTLDTVVRGKPDEIPRFWTPSNDIFSLANNY